MMAAMSAPPFPALVGDEVALYCAEVATGIILTLDGERAVDDSPRYRVCASLAVAESRARELVEDYPDRECWIVDRDENTLATIRPPDVDAADESAPWTPPRTIVGFVADLPVADQPPIGRELAMFVRAALSGTGLLVSLPEVLDWAWAITTQNGRLVARTLVGHVGDMDVVLPRQWLVTTTCTVPYFQRLVGRARHEAARERLLRTVHRALDTAFRANRRFSHIVWYDEATFDSVRLHAEPQ
jgi:hypothetical protein